MDVNTPASIAVPHPSVIETLIRRITQVFYGVGLVILAAMALLTLVDVIGRTGFNKPISGSYELTEYIFAMGVALVIGYSVFLKSHIRIDMVVDKLPMQAQVVLEIISHFFCFVFFLAMSWAVLQGAIKVQDHGTNSGVLAIPLFPVYYVLAFGSLLGGIVFFLYFLKVIHQKKLKVD
ncbi:MAG: TRAP transporter small permease subunit [Dehalococcoidales bacterium]|nr:TRAP transporter small permease subunit [Dehalococcoidales bacterium]